MVVAELCQLAAALRRTGDLLGFGHDVLFLGGARRWWQREDDLRQSQLHVVWIHLAEDPTVDHIQDVVSAWRPERIRHFARVHFAQRLAQQRRQLARRYPTDIAASRRARRL